MMRALCCCALLALIPVATANNQQQWNFRVKLDGRDIGEHRFTLMTRGETRQLRSEARFAVRLLFIDAWRYAHEASESWQGDCLQTLVARTETNGRTEQVRAETRDGRLLVANHPQDRVLDGCIMSFAYWNPSILTARQLLNSQTGELHTVNITPLGEESLTVRGAPQRAWRYRISAPPMQIDLWYAGAQWVGLETLVSGDRRLRYELS